MMFRLLMTAIFLLFPTVIWGEEPQKRSLEERVMEKVLEQRSKTPESLPANQVQNQAEKTDLGDNRPPDVRSTNFPAVFHPAGERFRVGREIRLHLNTSDPDGDNVTVRVDDLPKGASFDAEVNEFSWTPQQSDIGDHRIRFVANDGKQSTLQLARIRVMENRAPEWVGTHEYERKSGQQIVVTLNAKDPDRDDVRYIAENLPPGATFSESKGQFEWTPQDSQTGIYNIPVYATDGELRSDATILRLEIIEEWESVFLPGAYGQVYLPADSETYGTYYGVALELVFFSWIHLNDNRGPSHGRIYVRGELLNSTKTETPVAFLYSFGTSLSLERNPQRRWLIPYFGIELGGLLQSDAGHEFHVTPHAGLYFWNSRNIAVGINGGYLIAPSDLEGLRGWKASFGGNFTLW